MKKVITTTAIFLVLSLSTAFAQQKTVEEIYADYVQAIGGKEKLNNIENIEKVSIISSSSESISSWTGKKSTTSQIMVIEFTDFNSQEIATITCWDGNKAAYDRRLNANGKLIVMRPDVPKFEVPNTEQFDSDFLDTKVPQGSKVLPNGTFEGKEVYVINYEMDKTGTKSDVYDYFDIVSGLRIGSKQIDKTETSSVFSKTSTSKLGASTMVTSFEYKEIGDILYPYKTNVTYDNETTTTITSPSTAEMLSSSGMIKVDESKVDEKLKQKRVKIMTYKLHKEHEIEVVAVEFNIDADDFKQNCFQQPEACFAAYEKN